MEEVNPARRSSGVYDANHGNIPSSASDTALRGHAAIPAGISSAEGSVVDPTPLGDGQPTQFRDAHASHIPFYKKRWFIISQLIIGLIGFIMIFILLFPVVRAVVQLIVNKSTLDIQEATISNPTNNSFTLSMSGIVAHAGLVPATIRFTEPITVAWVRGENVTEIGTMQLGDPLKTHHARATLNQTTTFNVIDAAAFDEFSQYLITSSNFTWLLSSKNLRVNAVKFPVAKGISFKKRVTLNGLGSFNGAVILRDLQLPSDHPEGGINFVAVTELINQSPFTLDLGTIIFQLRYQNVFLGFGTGKDVKLTKGTNSVSLSGYLVRHDNEADLALVSGLFTNYLNGDPTNSTHVLAVGQSTLQNDGTAISWLSYGLKALTLTVPFKPPAPIDPIKSITIGELGLVFNARNPWAPIAQSNSVTATMKLPFGFNLSISEIRNDFNISKYGVPIAGLSTPPGASRSSISVLGPSDTEGTINITIENSTLAVPETQHSAFSSFNVALTDSRTMVFNLVGGVYANANTSIGTMTLGPINANVSTSLNGLDGLTGVDITAVDVAGGSADGIDLNINVTISNPSNLKLYVGDLDFQLLRNGSSLGNVVIRNLLLDIGNNSVVATSTFKPNGIPEGLQTLDDFVGHKDIPLTISGFQGSTNITSLAEAMQTLHINTTLPGLGPNLLSTASLTVLSTTRQNNISHVQVTLDNPFSASLHVTHVKSTVSSFGIPLGVIDTATDFRVAGKSTIESPVLNLNMNLDPSALFTLTRHLAVEAGLNVAPLDAIVALGGYHYLTPLNTSATRRQHDLFNGFDLPSFVQSAFKRLRSDVSLATTLSIGDYQTTLEFLQVDIPTVTDVSLNLLLPILAQPIVQRIVTGSILGIDNVLITNPQQLSFGTQLRGSIQNAGPFDADISFPSGLTVSWAGEPLGNLQMKDVHVVGDIGATINLNSPFIVADVGRLTDFTKVLLTQPSFDWVITGENLTVLALGISVPGISLSEKHVTLKGFNGLKGGVQIVTFDLPGDDPAGGIHLTLQAKTVNPSQVGIQLSSITFNTVAGGIMIASVQSAGEVLLAPVSTTILPLAGRLIPQTTPAGLATVSAIFNNFLHGADSDIIVQGAAAGPGEVTWLNEGIKLLNIETVLPNRGPLNIITSITINQMTMLFSSATAYDPSTSSNSTDAAFQIPFGFPLDIKALEKTLTIGLEGTPIAQLKIPKGPSVTDVQKRIIHIDFADIPFTVFDGQYAMFDQFLASTTIGREEEIQISGSASADALTAVGLLSLQNITFAVSSNISGLQGLDAEPPKITKLDVNHGYPNYLLIEVDSTLFNPSVLTIGTDDVSFALQFEDQVIGAANLNKLVITPGNGTYPIDVHYAPQGGSISAGRALLQNFLQGIDADTTIFGTTDSTPIQSLKQALSQIHLNIIIPALKENLVKSASLSFPIDIVSTGVASVSFVLANPFTASINMLRVGASAQFHNLTIGKINAVDVTGNPIRARGHTSITSPTLPLEFNLDPLSIIQVVTIASREKNLDLGPLAQLFQLVASDPNFRPPVITHVDTNAPTCISGQQFDFSGTILKSLSGLLVDLGVQTSVMLDDFATDLEFEQRAVPVNVDNTSLYLIGAVAGPIAQRLVDGATLSFDSAEVTNISNNGFDLNLVGSLTNVGPLDALIDFIEPLAVSWNGQDIAQLQLEPVCAAANRGVSDYRSTAKLTITDESRFTSFATFLLHNPSFEWTISTKKLRLTALGTIFDDVSLTKTVSFKAFNGLPGVSISNFNLPSDDPEGGIHIETDVTIPSPSQLGIELGTVTFRSFFRETFVGPLLAGNLSLAPRSTTVSHLSGRIVPQSGSDLGNIGQLFSTFLSGANSTLIARGDTVTPPDASEPVKWLSEAFSTLELPVILPGKQFNIIQSIELNDLSVTILSQDQAFAPPTSSSNTLARYKNPFGFALQVITASQNLTLGTQAMDVAQLMIPQLTVDGGVSTGNIADLRLSFKDLPLMSLNKVGFQQLFAAVTLEGVVDLRLRGTATVTARTSIGNIPISGIPFDVSSQLEGIGAFGHSASLSNVSVTGSGGQGGNEYIISPATTMLENPSNVSLATNNIALPVAYQGVTIGRAVIGSFDLHPSNNVMLAEFRYQPGNPNDTVAQSFLSRFIQTGDNIPLTIDGDYQSSPYESLQPALAGLHISTSLEGMNRPNLITHINVYITPATLITNRVSIDFDLHNPLSTEIVIEFVQSDGSVNGQIYAQFSHAFQTFAVPAGATVNSGTLDNVLLTQGAIGSLGIIPLGYLDISAANTIRVGGASGYQIPWLQIRQTRVPVTYDISLLQGGILGLGKSSTTGSGNSNTTSPGPTSDTPPTTSGATSEAASSTPATSR